MGNETRIAVAPRRRDEVLAYIVQRISLSGVCPTSGEIAKALGFSRQRATQLTNELVRADVLEKTPGSPRSLRIRDLVRCRHIITESLRSIGLTVSEPLGELLAPLSPDQLPTLPPFEHLPDPD